MNGGNRKEYEPSPDFSERRSSERHITTFRLVEVECNDDAGLGRCLNISDDGAAIHTVIPLSLGDKIKIAFSPSVSVKGRVVWMDEEKCGVQFSHSIVSEHILKTTSDEMRSPKGRSSRLKTYIPTKAYYEGKLIKTVILDISLMGIKLAHSGELQVGQKIKILVCDNLEKEGIIRWSHDGFAGIQLVSPFDVDDLGSVKKLGSQRCNDDPL